MRGKRRSILYAVPKSRITPADAGKTYRCSAGYHSGKDHPRGCGENAFCILHITSQTGSPPRMRGKQSDKPDATRRKRITPADAGKTDAADRQHHHRADHPRGCGENLLPTPSASLYTGSPPQVRGKQRHGCIEGATRRITPAGAGKTRRRSCAGRREEDHPRRCGENVPSSTISPYSTGSPPQVRGKRWREVRDKNACRITPAGAGKTMDRRRDV